MKRILFHSRARRLLSWLVAVLAACGAPESTFDSAGAPVTSACPSAAIAPGQSAAGALASTDCASATRSGRYGDRWTFSATAGTAYSIALGSSAFDTWLVLRAPAGAIVAQDDDSGGGTNSRIVYTPAESGTFAIEVTSYASGATGAYTLALSGGACTPAARAIAIGERIDGRLEAGDCPSARRPQSLHDRYLLDVIPGVLYSVTMTSTALDAYLFLEDPAGALVLYDDDGAGGTNATFWWTPTTWGTFAIEATSYAAATGAYSIWVDAGEPVVWPPAPPSSLSVWFERSVYSWLSNYDLVWRDNANDESGFVVEGRQGDGAWAEIARLPRNTTSYVHVVPKLEPRFTYRVRAYNSTALSDPSNEVAATNY